MHVFKLFLLFSFSFMSLTACSAQKKMIDYAHPQKGNTGHRGIVPKDEINASTQGKDYFALQLKTTKNATVEIVSLTVLGYGGQVFLKPIFTEFNKTKIKTKAGQLYYVRVEKEENCTVAKPNIKDEGVLVVKVNGKLQTLSIPAFEMVMPQ